MAAQRDADPVDTRVVKALGHPTRVRILTILRDRELASPVELSSELGIPLGTVGYHVRRLEALGFIELARRTQRRGAVEHHYRARQVLEERGTADVESGGPLARGDRGREAVALARAARSALARGGFDDMRAGADRRALVLDARGRAELARTLERWSATVERIARASDARLADAEAPARRIATAVLSFDVPEGVEVE
jgi:DNA-binding transcriptional ArsR family regulator